MSLSKARLGRIHDVMAGYIERGEVPGIVTLVSRRGEVHVDAIRTKVAAGGDLDDLRSQLVALRVTENPPGIDEAETAVAVLQDTIGAPPRVASPEHLDAVGAATRNLERALGDTSASPFAEAMKRSTVAVDALTQEVETAYKVPLE